MNMPDLDDENDGQLVVYLNNTTATTPAMINDVDTSNAMTNIEVYENAHLSIIIFNYCKKRGDDISRGLQD